MGKGGGILLGGVSVALLLVGLFTLPSSHGPLQTLGLHAQLALHLMGILPKQRCPKYGRIPKAPRPSNGTIKEVQGFVTPEEFHAKYLMKEPVIFRGGATKEWGFDLDCITKSGSVQDTMAEQMGDTKVRIFQDAYDDTSAKLMTIRDFEQLVQEASTNSSKPVPYARAFPQNSMRDCRPVPTDKLKAYHTWFGSLMQTYLPEPDVSLLFTSFAKDTDTKMHIDTGNSLITQVYGRKRWLFVDPEYVTDMKMWGDRLNLVFIGGYDVHREALPPEIPIREVIANPGDIIYFPSMTFHAVYNIDPVSVMVDHVSIDVLYSFTRHWLLTAATALNPRLAAKAISIYLNKGAFTATELYFDGFVQKEGEL